MILIQNAHVYAPEDRGICDILVSGNQIVEVAPRIDIRYAGLETIDASGKKAVPGFIDQHVHCTGGGGEGGFASRVPELQLSGAIRAGVTTLVGVLGTDSHTRSVKNLVAKVKGLKAEGLSAYCYTGAYELPSPTLTGTVGDDIMFIDEVIGVKIAHADHRSSHLTRQEMIRLASETRIAGLLSKKPGIVHIHVGPDPHGIEMILDIIRNTDIPAKHFRPTHMGRHPAQAVELTKLGGYADFTASDSTPDLLARLCREANPDLLTMSSDSNGSMPKWNDRMEMVGITAAKMTTLYESTRKLVTDCGMPLEQAVRFTTINVAKGLELYPRKGCLAAGSDADLVLLDGGLQVDTVMAMGRLMMRDGEVLVKGTFED